MSLLTSLFGPMPLVQLRVSHSQTADSDSNMVGCTVLQSDGKQQVAAFREAMGHLQKVVKVSCQQ